MVGYPWHEEGEEFVRDLDYVLELADESDVEKIREVAEVVYDACYLVNGVMDIATEVSQYSYIADILPKMVESVQSVQDWDVVRGFCHEFLSELLELEKKGGEIPGFEVDFCPMSGYWEILRRPPGAKTKWQKEKDVEYVKAFLRRIKEGELPPESLQDLRGFDEITLKVASYSVLPFVIDGRKVVAIDVYNGIPAFVSTEKVPRIVVPDESREYIYRRGIDIKTIEFVCVYRYSFGKWEEDEERGISRYREMVTQAIQSWGKYREEARKLHKIAQERGYKPGWVYYRLKEKYGHEWASVLTQDIQANDQEWYERYIVPWLAKG